MNVILNDDESIEDLMCNGLRLIQKKKGFRFGVDAVLLSNFADIPNEAQVLDLGTGTGVIPILLSAKSKAKRIVGLEIQESMVEMCQRSILLNDIGDKVVVLNGDIKNFKAFPKASFDVILSNPPYIKKNAGVRCSNFSADISRHEVLCTLEDVIKTASALLKVGGQLALVHKPERIADILCIMRQYKIEPKYLRMVHPSIDKKPNIILVKGARSGREDLKILPPLFVFDNLGNYSQEIYKIYGKESI